MTRTPVISLPLAPRPLPLASGMTLVELLLAIGLFSALMASVGGLLTSAARAGRDWGTAVEPYRRIDQALQRVEQDGESAQRFFGVPFIGASQTMELARIEPIAGEGGQTADEWVRVAYRLEPDAGQLWLVRDAFIWGASQGAAPQASQRLLAVADISLTFGMLDAQQQLIWAQSWDGATQGIPRLIKCEGHLAPVGTQPPMAFIRVIRNPSGSLPTTAP